MNPNTEPKLCRFDHLLKDFEVSVDKLEDARLNGTCLGPTSGFDKIDRELCGGFQPGLHVITGNTGGGKTALCNQIAALCGFPAFYVSCEMSSLEIFRRHIARQTKTPLHKLKDPMQALPASILKEKAMKTVEAISNLVIADATLAIATPEWIRDNAFLTRQGYKSEHILIVIDSLHTWASQFEGQEYDRLAIALDNLRQISVELNCPILLIAEQSKSANRENQKGKDYGSSSPAGFRGIEYGAETVIGLRADTDQQGNLVRIENGSIPVTLTFHKNRNGAGSRPFNMYFQGMYQLFEEAE